MSNKNENSPRTLKGDLAIVRGKIVDALESTRDLASRSAERVSNNRRQIGAVAVTAYLLGGWVNNSVEARGVQTVTVEDGLRGDMADSVEGYQDLTNGERSALATVVTELGISDGNYISVPLSVENKNDIFRFNLNPLESSDWDKDAAPHPDKTKQE